MVVSPAGVVPLVALNVLTGEAATLIGNLVMFPLMLAVMLRRRDEYPTPSTPLKAQLRGDP
jgi:hypothetical protein